VKPIQLEIVQSEFLRFVEQDVYLHLETTNGAYASHQNDGFLSAGAYIRNSKISFSRAKIAGTGPYRIGLKLNLGWIYGEGLTHYEITETGQLLLAGYNNEGKLAIALQLSHVPFE
jgi:hypothetical protein